MNVSEFLLLNTTILNTVRRKPQSEKAVREEDLQDEGTHGIAENNLKI